MLHFEKLTQRQPQLDNRVGAIYFILFIYIYLFYIFLGEYVPFLLYRHKFKRKKESYFMFLGCQVFEPSLGNRRMKQAERHRITEGRPWNPAE